jgi:hypothetical protein
MSENDRGGVVVKKVLALMVLVSILGMTTVVAAGPYDPWPPRAMSVGGLVHD